MQGQQQTIDDFVLQGHDIREDHINRKVRSRGIKLNTNQAGQNIDKQSKKKAIFLCILFLFILFTTSFWISSQDGTSPHSKLNLKNIKKDGKITATIIVKNQNEQQTFKSINSILSNSGITFSEVFVFCNYQYSLQKLGKLSMDVNWVFTQKRQDLALLDQLISYAQTQYFYFSTTEWLLQDPNFIRYSIEKFQSDSNIIQVIAEQPNEKEKIIDQTRPIGFSFRPGLHRTLNYLLSNGGYSTIAGPECLLTPQCQKVISQFYLIKGFHTIVSNTFKINKIIIPQEIESFASKTNKQKQRNKIKKQLQNKYQSHTSHISQNKPKPIKSQKTIYTVNPPTPPTPITPSTLNKPNSNIKHTMQFSSHIPYITSLLKTPQKIHNIQKLTQIKQLPFCLVLSHNQNNKEQVLKSIQAQNYSNYKIIMMQKQIKSYYSIKQKINQQCADNDYIMFINSSLRLNALYYLNSQHQKQKAWVTYSKTDHLIEIYSFLYRIYQLIDLNDFSKLIKPSLEQGNIQYQTLAMLQMCRCTSKQVQKQKILYNQLYTYFSITDSTINHKFGYVQYAQTYRLSQNMQVNSGPYITWTTNAGSLKVSPLANINQNQMMQAVNRQQLIYLPENHTIAQLEYIQYNQKYNVSQYKQKQKQLSLCLTILNHNNIQNDRYKKAIKSILQQKYQNYHIVFIDDNSTDGNLDMAIKYFQKLQFPTQRITFIQNLHRNYATYNILNAAFNYCHQKDIQIIFDGDDQIIGRYAFQVINAVYQSNPNLWVVYTSYKTSSYQYGRSIPFLSESAHMLNGKRQFVTNIGPIRTWRVQLIYNIPDAHHKMADGNWLDTVYDDALQHPLVELSTVNRTKYINQIMYDYNVRYGDNDDSNSTKIKHRTQTYQYILKLTPLNPLSTLQGSIKDKDVAKALAQDVGIKYKKLTI